MQAFDSAGLLTGRFTYHTDHLGSVRFMTDQAGNIANEYDYDSYGRVTGEVETVEQPFGFTGRDYDEAVNLYQYRARAYDPETGRFIQEDPLHFNAGDLNIYRYVGNNVVNRSDPSGLTAATSTGGLASRGILRSAPQVGTVGLAIACTFGVVSATLEIANEVAGLQKTDPTISIGDIALAGCGATGILVRRSSRLTVTGIRFAARIASGQASANGRCTPERKRQLQENKDRACRRPRSCRKKGLSESDILNRIANANDCISARQSINNECFFGGDKIHQAVLQFARDNLNICKGFL